MRKADHGTESALDLGGAEAEAFPAGPGVLSGPSPSLGRGRPPLEVVAGIIWRRHQREVLIAQRRWNDTLGGHWEFPGGKVERGESEETALRREFQEELGIDVEVGLMVHEASHRYPTRLIRLRFFRAWIIRGTPRPREVAAVRWVKVNRLGTYKFPPADKELLHLLMQRSLG
jgi:8-oxo-dGTP diphosphatase